VVFVFVYGLSGIGVRWFLGGWFVLGVKGIGTRGICGRFLFNFGFVEIYCLMWGVVLI